MTHPLVGAAEAVLRNIDVTLENNAKVMAGIPSEPLPETEPDTEKVA
jgi:hypothetical protein